MGHYDDNRKFDDEWRANGGVVIDNKRIVPGAKDPEYVDSNQVMIRVEHLTPSTFNRWTDGSKWICDTINAGIERKEGVGKVTASVTEIAEFIHTYPHPVGTFYVIVSHIRHAVEIVEANPTRDIRILLISK